MPCFFSVFFYVLSSLLAATCCRFAVNESQLVSKVDPYLHLYIDVFFTSILPITLFLNTKNIKYWSEFTMFIHILLSCTLVNQDLLSLSPLGLIYLINRITKSVHVPIDYFICIDVCFPSHYKLFCVWYSSNFKKC